MIEIIVPIDNTGTNKKNAPMLARNIALAKARRRRIVIALEEQAGCHPTGSPAAAWSPSGCPVRHCLPISTICVDRDGGGGRPPPSLAFFILASWSFGGDQAFQSLVCFCPVVFVDNAADKLLRLLQTQTILVTH
jgi:hypothetical protein